MALGLTATLFACGKQPPTELADRLWVAEMPTGPRDMIHALVLTKVGKRDVGSFYHGSIYRGVHDSFSWKSRGKNRGVIKLLQDQREFEVEIKSCKPDRGFDMCVLVEGDPKRVVRYQSRKRWAIPRRGAEEHGAPEIPALIHELGDDDELEELFEE